MFSPLKKNGALNGGLKIGILGFGSLGKWAAKLAKAMKNEVFVIMTSNTKQEMAYNLGFKNYINSKVTKVKQVG